MEVAMDISIAINKVISFFKNKKQKNFDIEIKSKSKLDPQSYGGTVGYNPYFQTLYNGEKDMGELGPIKNYRPNYEALRIRSWQSYYESEISQTILNKYVMWVIGKGLKLQVEPIVNILEDNKIKIQQEDFTRKVESLFHVFKSNTKCDYANMCSLDKIASTALMNSLLGGDVLVILRYENDNISVQLVDGSHVRSPGFGIEFFPQLLPNGNRILNGIEMTPTGEHVAYYVCSYPSAFMIEPFKYERISAVNSLGMRTAFLVHGSEYRLDNVRGVPILSAVLETLHKLERYKEATVGSAEERQKIAFSIEHEAYSTGESPLSSQLARAFDSTYTDAMPKTVDGRELANQVAATTNKQAYNLPVGAHLKLLESKNELYFKDFYTVNKNSICSALAIPPDVAMSIYDSSFSASRTALKDWEHILNVKRNNFSNEFYRPIFKFWFDINVYRNKINANGYLTAKQNNNDDVIYAYTHCRFVGSPVPHIDPVKEVTAERLKLGDLAGSIPLTTVEAATEALNGGESFANIEQFSKELEKARQLDLINDSKSTDDN